MNIDRLLSQIKTASTPLYCYDMALLDSTVKCASDNAKQHGFIIHYALKANSDERILEVMRKYEFGVDCVSGNEVRHSVEHGFNPNSIVFAGVGKTDSEISYAMDYDIFSFNCESYEELKVINQLAASKNKQANVALRVNPDVDPQTHKFISTGKAHSKFGISQSELLRILSNIDTFENIKIKGLHFHIGSQITNMKVFEELCQKVNIIVEWFGEHGLEFEYLNLGGGLGIDYDDPDKNPIPDFNTYFGIFNSGIKRKEDQQLHFELGRSLVGQCGALITRVLYNKLSGSSHNILIVDAGMNNLMRPALYGAKHKILNLTSKEGELKYTVVGPVCESSDVFSTDIMLAKCSRDDIIAIKSTGAYGISMASKYNMRDEIGSLYI